MSLRNLAMALALGALALRPAGAFTLPAGQVMLMPYFQGNYSTNPDVDTSIWLDYSTDGVHFSALNNGQPIFTPGNYPAIFPSGQRLSRDPSIVYHDGVYHMVFTTGFGAGGSSATQIFGYAESTDLQNWTNIKTISPAFTPGNTPTNLWAPEVQWDPAQKNFMITWASTVPSELRDGDGSQDTAGNDHRLYITRTSDFSTFTAPQVYLNVNYSSIDGMSVYDTRGTATTMDDRWVLVAKDEQQDWDGGKNLRIFTTDPQMKNPYQLLAGPVVGSGTTVENQHAEGPTLVKVGDTWYLYFDSYDNHHYSLASSTDLINWTDMTSQLSFPGGDIPPVRHGTFFLTDPDTVAFLSPSFSTVSAPEPASLGLLAAGAVVCLRRKRRA